MVVRVDCFQKSVECAQMYLTLTADTSPPYAAVQITWLRKQLEKAGIRHDQHWPISTILYVKYICAMKHVSYFYAHCDSKD